MRASDNPVCTSISAGTSDARDGSAQEALREDLEALVAGRLRPTLHFQPIANLRLGTVAGYEALARLPVRAGLPPDLCLQAARQFGLELQLEAMLARMALQARSLLPRNTFLSINTSPGLLGSSFWQAILRDHQDLSGVVLEITEGECISDYAQMRVIVKAITECGGLIAIDDAGSGYASLRHILELKPNFIKLDRDLVQGCHEDRAKATLIEVLGAAANRMDAWVITEGVETASELGELLRLEVPLAQGYFLGRPMPGWQGLSAASLALMKAMTAHRTAQQNLVLHAEVCFAAPSREEAHALLRSGAALVAVVDEWERPLELLHNHELLGVRVVTAITKCHLECDLQEALHRALTRHSTLRFDPVLLTDGEGRLRGVVQVDRLMMAILHAKDRPRAI